MERPSGSSPQPRPAAPDIRIRFRTGHRVFRRVVEQLGGQFGRRQVSGVVGVGGNLHGELATGAEGRGPTGDDPGVVGEPLERGVGEDDVAGVRPFPLPDVPDLEGQVV